LRKKLSQMMEVMQDVITGERTIRQLLESAEQEQKQSERRKEQEAEALRVRELEALAQRETAAWEDVEALIQKGTSKSYDEVVPLLLKLRDLADYQNQQSKFLTRLKQLHAQYSSRSGLKKRLLQANL
jgi:regulator of protease activity HflC (stomatin/prohibitin superfamily)